MAIKIRVNEQLRFGDNGVPSLVEYTTETLVLLTPSLQTQAVLFTWVSPGGTRFEERSMFRDPSFDETGYFAYKATIYPVMSIGLMGEQTTAKASFSFRIGSLFSPFVRIPVLKSLFPEQTELPPTESENLSVSINELSQDSQFLRTTKADTSYVNFQISGLETATNNALGGKVDKVVGKQLSTDDFVQANHYTKVQSDTKFETIANVDIERLRIAALEGSDAAQDTAIASKLNKDFNNYLSKNALSLSDILVINDSSDTNLPKNTTIGALSTFINASQSDFGFLVVTALPTVNIDTNKIYLLTSGGPGVENIYDEYIYINNSWEKIGTLDVNLTDYYNKTEVDGLLANKAAGTHTHLEADITDLDKYTRLQVDTLLLGKSDTGHAHTKSDITDLIDYVLPQATGLVLGGVVAEARTTENVEVKIDGLTGKLFVPQYPVDTGEVNTIEAIKVNGTLQSPDVSKIVDISVPTDLNQLADSTNLLFSGNYNDLTNKPVIASIIGDLGDVSVITPSSGQVLKYNGIQWVNDSDIGEVNVIEDIKINGISVAPTAKSVDLTAVPIETVVPTAAYAGPGRKIVILSSEPVTKYSGWIYLITA